MLTAVFKKNRAALGRIGLEFDTHGLFCAQVRQDGKAWEIIHSRAFAAGEDVLTGNRPNGSLVPFASTELLMAAAGFRGSDVASVLPMEACDLRMMELPAVNAAELTQMVSGEIESMMPQNTLFDFWQLPEGMATRKDVTGICSLCTDRVLVSETVDSIHKAGFTISGIDGLPTACARATAMMCDSEVASVPSQDSGLRMALHIGWKSCLLVLVRDGVPVLARVPQVGGLHSFLMLVADCLKLSVPGALRLIRGIHQGLPVHLASVLECRISSAARNWCLPICEEILRSIAFAKRPGLRMVPSACIVMGAGGVVPKLADIMSLELNMDVLPWSLPCDSGCSSGPEYAIAAALSGWEIDS